MQTDTKRLQQVLKNLLSNAFKFTERGLVTLSVRLVREGWTLDDGPLARASEAIAFAVRDTGIGIPPEKQQIIFEAFQQADGSTSRKYGGTGLGLAISREIANMLGGEIRLASKSNEGSTFTLFLPLAYAPLKATPRRGEALSGQAVPPALAAESSEALPARSVDAPSPPDDSDDVRPGDRVVLVVENDPAFARVVIESARESGFKAILAMRGAAALGLARHRRPDAITLDLNLPEIDGWHVLERLKRDLTTRHIPVQVITTEEEDTRALRLGARGVLRKPLKTRETLDQTLTALAHYVGTTERRVLLVAFDGEQGATVGALLAGGDVRVERVATSIEALERLRSAPSPDLLVLHGLDAETAELVDAVEKRALALPIIAHVPDLQPESVSLVERIARRGNARHVRSLERLFDEASFLLHRRTAAMSAEQRAVINRLYLSNEPLKGKKVLIVDDDTRNIFALTTLLEDHQVTCLSAETGRTAIAVLAATPDINLVLMDIMMPEIDGYDTMRAIRSRPELRRSQSSR